MAFVEPDFKSEISSIQREMARARRQIHQDVGGAIDGVQTLTDWRTIVRAYPWLSVSVAAAVGYMIVPRRAASGAAKAPKTRVQANDVMAPVAGSAPRRSEAGKWALLSSAFAAISPIALRLAQSYALRYFENWLHGRAFPSVPEEQGHASGQAGARTYSATGPREKPSEFPMRG